MSESNIKEILRSTGSSRLWACRRSLERQSQSQRLPANSMATASYPSTPSQTKFSAKKATPACLRFRRKSRKPSKSSTFSGQQKMCRPIMEQAIKLKQKNGKPYVVWMQLGIVNEEAAEAGRRAGLIVVMDKCLMVEHHRLASAGERQICQTD